MRCPHCNKNTDEISDAQIDFILKTSFLRIPDEVKELITAFSKALPKFSKRDLGNFLFRVQDCSADDIHFGITYFLKNELHHKGKHWQYCSAIIERRSHSRIQAEKNKLQTLPPFNG